MALLLRLLMLLMAAVISGPAAAENYPDRPIHLIVPFAPGGPTDVVARLVSAKLSDKLGQPILVENRSGADSVVGASYVAKASPDGYTLLLNGSSHAQDAATYASLPYDTETAFAPVSLLVVAPLLLVVNPSLPVHTTPELIAYAKSHTDKLNFGSAGTGGAPHLAGEMFKKMAGIDMTHVPYKGGGPALVSLEGNEIQLMFAPVLVALPIANSGQIRALAVTSAKRVPSLPEMPSVAETLPGYEAVSWYALFAPAGTPPAIITQLNVDLDAMIKAPDVKERFAAIGGEAAGGPPERLGKLVHDEIIKWGKVAKDAGVQIQ